jgi:hypothetical protein
MTFSPRSEVLSNSIGAAPRFFTFMLIGRLAGAYLAGLKAMVLD